MFFFLQKSKRGLAELFEQINSTEIFSESLKNAEIFLALLPFPEASRAIFFVILTFFQK
jgi:hypothetical protein